MKRKQMVDDSEEESSVISSAILSGLKNAEYVEESSEEMVPVSDDSEEEQQQQGVTLSEGILTGPPLSVRNNSYKWNSYRFFLNVKSLQLYSEEQNKEVVVNLKGKTISRTSGLWPGFQVIDGENVAKFHAESESDILKWMDNFKLLKL